MSKPAAPKNTPVRPEAIILSALRILWKQRYAAAAIAIVVTGSAAVFVHRLPSVYEAESLIMVDSQKIPEKFVASTVQLSLQDSLETIRQQILSATRLQKLMDEFGLYPEERKTFTIEELTDKMRSEISTPMEKSWGTGRSGAFRVKYEGPDPKVVAAVVNQIAALFIEENLKTREMRAEGTSDFIESQLEESRKSLETQERALSDYKVNKLGELPQQEATLTGTLTRLQSNLQASQAAIDQAELNRFTLENNIRAAEAAEAALKAAAAGAAVPQTASPALAGLAAAVQAPPVISESQRIAAELDALRLRYRDQHPDVQRLTQQLRELRERERKEPAPERAAAAAATTSTGAVPPTTRAADTAPVAPVVAAEIAREREKIAVLRTQIDVLVKQNEARAREKEAIKRQIAELQMRLERLPVREQELASLTRDYENSRQNYRSLLDKRTSAEMASEMERRQQAERFRILDPAHVPTKPVKPNRPVFYAGGAIAGLMVGVFAGALLELRKNLVLGDWELPADIAVLGRVSYLQQPDRRSRRRASQKAGVAA